MGYVIAICQSKGGSAKTTTAINLCGALIEKGFKTLVADMDRDKPDALSWSKQGKHINFVTELFEEKPLDIVEHFRKTYDYIILDTPPNYMPAAFKAIMMADFVILPCSPSFLDQSNLVDAITIPRMAKKPFKILGCKIQKRQKLSKKLISELIKSGQAFSTSISHNTAVLESPFHGKWLGNYKPGCSSHKEFLSLAEEVIKIANVKVTAYPAFLAPKSTDNVEKRVSPV
jgi:chromosome partitioning protein